MIRSFVGLAAVAVVLAAERAAALDPQETSALRAVIRAPARNVSVGSPVWIEFAIQNDSDEAVRVDVPGAKQGPAEPAIGLPISHVFSGKAFTGLTIEAQGRSWDIAEGYHPPATAPELVLAPHASVGTRIDVTQYYPVLETPGRYRLQWTPYDGATRSNTLHIEIAPLKQAVIQTDYGEMTVRFFYEDAREAVANFIELARAGFYNGLTFHRIHPGHYIQGGDPNGDGTGIRLDGKKLPAELSDRPQQRGTVSMATLPSDPDSGSCQFFICNTREPAWDGLHTVFGELVGEGSLETLDQLMAKPVEEGTGRPRKTLYIRSIRIENVPDERTFGGRLDGRPLK